MPRARKKRDPNAPKVPLTAYMFFCRENREKVKELHPNFSFGEFGKELGRLWKQSDSSVRDVTNLSSPPYI